MEKNPGLFCKVKWRVKRFTKIHKDLEQITEKKLVTRLQEFFSTLTLFAVFSHVQCELEMHKGETTGNMDDQIEADPWPCCSWFGWTQVTAAGVVQSVGKVVWF